MATIFRRKLKPSGVRSLYFYETPSMVNGLQVAASDISFSFIFLNMGRFGLLVGL